MYITHIVSYKSFVLSIKCRKELEPRCGGSTETGSVGERTTFVSEIRKYVSMGIVKVIKRTHVSDEFFEAVKVHIVEFWVIPLCILVDGY